MKTGNFPGKKNARRQRAYDRLLDNVPRKIRFVSLKYTPKSSVLKELGLSTEEQIEGYNKKVREEIDARHKAELREHRAACKKLAALIVPAEEARMVRTKKDRSSRGKITR